MLRGKGTGGIARFCGLAVFSDLGAHLRPGGNVSVDFLPFFDDCQQLVVFFVSVGHQRGT